MRKSFFLIIYLISNTLFAQDTSFSKLDKNFNLEMRIRQKRLLKLGQMSPGMLMFVLQATTSDIQKNRYQQYRLTDGLPKHGKVKKSTPRYLSGQRKIYINSVVKPEIFRMVRVIQLKLKILKLHLYDML